VGVTAGSTEVPRRKACDKRQQQIKKNNNIRMIKYSTAACTDLLMMKIIFP
jgi:hypothetical protein